jgi:hypothetical protein
MATRADLFAVVLLLAGVHMTMGFDRLWRAAHHPVCWVVFFISQVILEGLPSFIRALDSILNNGTLTPPEKVM